MGLMIGVKLKKDLGTVVKECVDKGVLVLTANGCCASCRPQHSLGCLEKSRCYREDVIDAE